MHVREHWRSRIIGSGSNGWSWVQVTGEHLIQWTHSRIPNYITSANIQSRPALKYYINSFKHYSKTIPHDHTLRKLLRENQEKEIMIKVLPEKSTKLTCLLHLFLLEKTHQRVINDHEPSKTYETFNAFGSNFKLFNSGSPKFLSDASLLSSSVWREKFMFERPLHAREWPM